MKLCRFDYGRLGVVQGDVVRDVTPILESLATERWPAWQGDALTACLGVQRPAIVASGLSAPGLDLASVRLRAPVASPPRVIAVRENYAPSGAAVAARPDLFLKSATSVAGPADGIPLRFPGRRTDHELELAVVIGVAADRVAEADALACVAGYCIGLDITLRGDEDRGLRKSLDGHSILGPWLTTADEAGGPGARRMELSVNGRLRQSGNTSDMLHGVARIIAFASDYMTLLPGDVILTGTPPGAGPIEAGDVIDCSIEGLGAMRVVVRMHGMPPSSGRPRAQP